MSTVASLDQEPKGIKGEVINWVSGLPDSFALPLLHQFRRRRPEHNVWYANIEQDIQTQLQTILVNELCFNASVVPIAPEKQFPWDCQYFYRLVLHSAKSNLADGDYLEIFYALAKKIDGTDIDLSYNIDEKALFIKLRLNTRRNVLLTH